MTENEAIACREAIDTLRNCILRTQRELDEETLGDLIENALLLLEVFVDRYEERIEEEVA